MASIQRPHVDDALRRSMMEMCSMMRMMAMPEFCHPSSDRPISARPDCR